MKSLLILLVALSGTYASATNLSMDPYRNTVWESQDDDSSDEEERVVFRVTFDDKNLTYEVLYCTGDECTSKASMKFKDVSLYPSQSIDGIHARQPIFAGTMEGGEYNGKLVSGFLYVAERGQCILLPDTEAPEDCLRQK